MQLTESLRFGVLGVGAGGSRLRLARLQFQERRVPVGCFGGELEPHDRRLDERPVEILDDHDDHVGRRADTGRGDEMERLELAHG